MEGKFFGVWYFLMTTGMRAGRNYPVGTLLEGNRVLGDCGKLQSWFSRRLHGIDGVVEQVGDHGKENRVLLAGILNSQFLIFCRYMGTLWSKTLRSGLLSSKIV